MKANVKKETVIEFMVARADAGDSVDDIKTQAVIKFGATISETNKLWKESGASAGRQTADWLSNYLQALEEDRVSDEKAALALLEEAPKGVRGRWIRVYRLATAIREQ